jgi:hypothetical protein
LDNITPVKPAAKEPGRLKIKYLQSPVISERIKKKIGKPIKTKREI